MKLAKFLSWGSKKAPEPSEQPAESTSAQQAEPSVSEERRRSPRRPAEDEGHFYWIAEDGEPTTVKGRYIDESDGGAGSLVDSAKEIPLDASVWFITSAGVFRSGFVRNCGPRENGFRVGFSYAETARTGGGWGAVRLRWLAPPDASNAAPASIRNADEGVVEVNSGAPVPLAELVMLDGCEYSCLAVSRRCEAYGDRHLLELQVISPAYRKLQAA